MALSVTLDSKFGASPGLNAALARNAAIVWGSLSMDDSYPTGGESVTIPGLMSIGAVICDATGGYVFKFDVTNSKLKALYSDNEHGTAASTMTPLVEVSNGADLSGLSDVNFIAAGFTA